MPRPSSASYKSRDRGPTEFESKLHEEEGKIMQIAQKDVLTIPPSLPIKETSERMVKYGKRRLPITSPGTDQLQGMVVTRDIVDFLGGGDKHQIIEKKHDGNFLSAINEHVKIIMNPDPPHADSKESIVEVAKLLLETGVGGVPIVNKEGKIVGIVTERDFARYMPSPANVKVKELMASDLAIASPNLTLIEAMKKMISESFRRLPVIDDGETVGILTSTDVLEYFGSNEVFNNMVKGDASDAMSIKVKELMSKKIEKTTPEEDVGEVARKMEKDGTGGLLVIDNGNLAGIITERDILKILL